jgi:hypothetical protein
MRFHCFFRGGFALFLSIFLTIAVPAQAVELRFTRVSEYLAGLPLEQRLAQEKEAAAVKKLVTSDGECTASYVSRSGHLLTARHCLKNCMIREGLFHMVYEQGTVSYFVLEPEKLGRVECPARLGEEDVDLVIESTSPGILLPFDENSLKVINQKLYERLVQAGYTSRGDFVIARVKRPEDLPTSCLPLASSPASPGSAVHSFGYPSETKFSDGANSDGKSFYATAGKVIPTIFKNSCLENQPLSEYERQKLEDAFDDPADFMSTLDAIFGSSGSPVINSEGRLTGILTNVFQPAYAKAAQEANERRCSGSAKALRIEQVWRVLQQQNRLSADTFCPQPP